MTSSQYKKQISQHPRNKTIHLFTLTELESSEVDYSHYAQHNIHWFNIPANIYTPIQNLHQQTVSNLCISPQNAASPHYVTLDTNIQTAYNMSLTHEILFTDDVN